MKNKSLLTVIAYLFLAVALVLFLSGCRTKKSTTDFKQTETENVSIVDNSTFEKKETVQENNQENKKETVIDKSFFEAWMEIKSDEATFEDKAGNKWTFKNPQVNQKSSQTNDISKTNQTDIKKEKSAVVKENLQNNVAVSNNRQIKTDLNQTESSKGKEPVSLYFSIGFIVLVFGYLILKRFNVLQTQ